MRDIPELRENTIVRVEVGKQGRIVIPAHIRQELGIEEGTRVGVRVNDGVIELITPETAKRQLREMFKHTPENLSEELLAERRAEAAADAAEELAALSERARRL